MPPPWQRPHCRLAASSTECPSRPPLAALLTAPDPPPTQRQPCGRRAATAPAQSSQPIHPRQQCSTAKLSSVPTKPRRPRRWRRTAVVPPGLAPPPPEHTPQDARPRLTSHFFPSMASPPPHLVSLRPPLWSRPGPRQLAFGRRDSRWGPGARPGEGRCETEGKRRPQGRRGDEAAGRQQRVWLLGRSRHGMD